jgi:YggT family protein
MVGVNMNGLTRFLLSVISGALMLYSTLIFIRIILSWFSGINFGRFYIYLCRLTDPYLLWFTRFKFLRAGNIDLSPIVALATLSVVSNIVSKMASSGRVTFGFVLSLLLSVVWSAISFIIVFFIAVIGLRLVAYIISANTYTPFWKVVDYLSRPVIFNINRILFRNRIVNYFLGIVITLLALVVLLIALWTLIHVVVSPLLIALPF